MLNPVQVKDLRTIQNLFDYRNRDKKQKVTITCHWCQESVSRSSVYNLLQFIRYHAGHFTKMDST